MKKAPVTRVHEAAPRPTANAFLAPCNTVISPNRSRDSVSLDETMSTCDSMKSPDFEYIDNGDSSIVASLERRATDNLRISEDDDDTLGISFNIV